MITIFRAVSICFLLAVAGKAAAQLTMTPLTPTQDCYANYTSATTATFVNNTELRVRVTTASTAFNRTYVQYDLTGIPANAVIVSATLTFRVIAETSTTDLTLQTVTTPWSETATGTVNPTSTNVNEVLTNSAPSAGYRQFDVTTLVKNIHGGFTTNYGWVLKRTNEAVTSGLNWYYSNNTTDKKPALDVTWYYPMAVSAAAIDFASTTTSLDASIAPTLINGPGVTNTYEWRNNSNTVVGSSSLTLSGVPYGCYWLKVTPGSYDPFYMAFLVGVDCETVPISFSSPLQMPNFVDDAMVSGALVDYTTNYGNIVNNFTERNSFVFGSNTIWYYKSSYMRFRLWMPSTLVPLQANLFLYGNGHNTSVSAPNNSKISRITDDWKEMIIKFSTLPGFSDDIMTAIPATTPGSVNQDMTVDMKNFWGYWKTDNTQNFGVRLNLVPTTNVVSSQVYHSADGVTTAKRPKIDFILDDGTCDRTSYATFRRELDAGYVFTFQGKLKFQFTEEYKIDAGKKIPLTVYDEDRVIKAGIAMNGTALTNSPDLPLVTYPLLPALTYNFDDNSYVLDLSTYGLVLGQFYTLQLTRSTGEKEYIRFQYIN